MKAPSRYALYFVPSPQSSLYRFGSSVLGYDCYMSAVVGRPACLASESWNEMTEEPRRYGFHATLKAPFHLRPSCNEAQLISAVKCFAGLGHAVPVIKPVVQALNGFLAIVPLEHEQSLDNLAASCTTIFDAYRAPMSPRDRARRIALGLNISQIQNLDRWGYPFVLSEFRFHMTLTGKIPTRRVDETLAILQKLFQDSCAASPVSVDRLALVKQEGELAPFRIISQVML
jgi:hypothetical protein